MTEWPEHPVVHEIFTWVWLEELSRTEERSITLADVPDEVWDAVARPGIDAVWLMGVWQRSEVGAAIARTNESMRAADRAALPDFTDADVVGSAYCVRDYVVDDRLGGERGLAIARRALAERGVRLVLDFVPNHVAPDHPWVRSHPEYFVHGTVEDLERQPEAFIDVDGSVFACGRDPYFPTWPEVLQLDASRPDLRQAMAEVVVSLTQRCDGLRCDMAMLVLNDVFRQTWGQRAGGGGRSDPGGGFWPTVIGAVRAARPDFAMWAEVYWDLESTLIDQGFDACYDKRLYDRIVHRAPVPELRAHIAADLDAQRHTLRFIENHDELRAAVMMSAAEHTAALATVLTLPGVALLHEGEAEGRRVRIPVTLGRRPAEPTDRDRRIGVDRLLAALGSGMRRGSWALLDVDGWPDNRSCERLLAWSWTSPEQRHLIVVNLSDEPADGRVRLPWDDLGTSAVLLHDLMSGRRFDRDGAIWAADGLYVLLDGASLHLFEVLCVPSTAQNPRPNQEDPDERALHRDCNCHGRWS